MTESLVSKEQTVNTRSMWGDIAKGIAIIMVVAGHSFNPAGAVCKAVFLVHMPVFFFIAGYFMNFEKYKDNFKGLLKSTYNRIFIPAIFSFILFYNIFSKDDLMTLLYAVGKPVEQFEINPIGYSMWFLFCLIVLRIFLYAFLKLTDKFNTPIAVNIIITLIIIHFAAEHSQILKLPWSADIALVALNIAYIGYLFKKYSVFQKRKWALLLVPLALVLGYFDFKYLGLSMNERFYSAYPVISVSISVLLCVLICYMSIFLEKIRILNKLLAYLGINSLIIMIFHCVSSSSHGGVICTLWRLLICVLIIEGFAQIPQLKSLYGAKSVFEVFKQQKGQT